MRKKSISSTNESQKSGRQAVYQRGNQREGSPYYVFLCSEDEQSEDEDHIPLKKRNHARSLPCKIEVINVNVQSEDTLQALALRYRCTISELKRINKIHKDNEIHAHHSIKVPVQSYSVLTENVLQNSENDIPLNVVANNISQPTIAKENETFDLLTDPTSLTSTVEINTIILNSTVTPLSQINNESIQFEEGNETTQLINPLDQNKIKPNSNILNTFKCSGADWGLSWFQLLCFSLLLGFAGPIIYVLFIAESSKHNHLNNS